MTYAEWFANLAEPTRVRLLHSVTTTPGGITIGQLTQLLSISQSTCSHHVRKLADIGFLKLHKEGTSTRVMINPACCMGLPHTSDAAKPDAEDPARWHGLEPAGLRVDACTGSPLAPSAEYPVMPRRGISEREGLGSRSVHDHDEC